MMYDDAPLLRLRLQEIHCLIPSRILCAAVFEGPTLDHYIRMAAPKIKPLPPVSVQFVSDLSFLYLSTPLSAS